MAVITRLFVYRVKSCRGIELQASGLAEHGFQHDRGWMVVDAQNRVPDGAHSSTSSANRNGASGGRIDPVQSSSDREPVHVPLHRKEAAGGDEVTIDGLIYILNERFTARFWAYGLLTRHQLSTQRNPVAALDTSRGTPK